MASDYSDMETGVTDSTNKPSDFANMEDSDSVCDSMLEYYSDAGNDDASTADSTSHNFPTVRAKLDGEVSEIEKLITAAEVLAMERVKLKKLSDSEPEADKLSQNLAHLVGSRASESNFRAAESCSFVKDADVKQIFSVAPSNHIHLKEDLSNFHETKRKFHNFGESGQNLTDSASDLILSKTAAYPETKTCIIPEENEKLEGACFDTIPRLSLELANDGMDEERIIVSKDVKEVCNSTIKESSTDNSETEMTGYSKNAERPGSTKRSLPQAGIDSISCGSHDLKEVSVIVHDECSSLVSLALTSTSSLNCAIRLLRQVTTLQFGMDTPRVAENVKHELMEFEAQHRNLETQLSNAAARLQMAVAQVQEIEILLREQYQEAARMEKYASQILGQVEGGLDLSGLQHMVAVTSPRRRNTARMMEDIASALTLLMGELNRKMLHTHNLEEELRRHSQEIQTLRETLLDKDSRLRSSDFEVLKLKEQSSAEATSLRQCLAQAEKSLSDAELEKMRIGETLKKQAVENSTAMVQLQHKLSNIQRDAESRVCHLEYRLQDNAKEKQNLESTIADLKNQLSLRTQQINLVDEENNLLVEGLRSTLKHQQAELEQLRAQLEDALTQKNILARRLKELEIELSAEKKQHQELLKEALELKTLITNLKLEQTETERALQDKIDSGSSTQCELKGQVRSLELTILQLRTELQMERHRSTSLYDETRSLHKKVKDLQDRIWYQARRRRNNSSDSMNSKDSHHSTGGSACGKESSSEYGSCLSLLPTAVGNNLADQQVQCIIKDVEDGQAREEHLHTLLREKDAALHSLQHSLSNQINSKNQELEALAGKVSVLEDQLGSLLSALEVSAAVGSITTEVGSLLQERTEHINSLDKSSHLLQEEMSSLALENQTLSNELIAAKRNQRDASTEAKESARNARQEARDERLAAAHLKEKCLQLQAKLDSVQSTLEQERQERRLHEVVNVFKHQEFGSLLDSATALQETAYSGLQ